MIYKNKLVESVMDDLKKIVPEVHQQILESDVNEDIIFSNINILLKLLDDRTKKQADFTVEISLKDDEFEWKYVASTPEDVLEEETIKIKKQYLIHDFASKKFLIDLNNPEDFEKTSARAELIYKFVDLNKESNFHKGVWVYGPSGVGKTHAMIGILNKYAREGKLVAHVSMASTISKFTVTTNFIRNQEGFDVLMKKMKLADVLVLDDIGTESPSKFTRDDFLFNILNYRMENNKLTFVTSNASVNEYLNYVSGIVAKSRKEDGLKVDRLKTRINALMNEVHVIGKDRRK